MISRSKVKLDQEQIRGVYEVCSGKRWVNISGHAGTGKTSLLRVAVDAQREEWAATQAQRQGKDQGDGGQIVVVSMAAATAQRTGHKLGADRYGSVESLLTQIEKGRWHPGRDDLFIVEEVGQMDTLRMDKLLRAVGNARVVLVGDAAQLTPIGAGGWYQDQLDRHGSVELTVVRRHQDPRDVADFGLIRTGRAEEALRNLADRQRVRVSEDQSHRMAEVLADYRDFRNAGHLAKDIRIIVDTSNHDIDIANRFVQRDRIKRGELREQGFEVHDVEQDRRWTIREGDQVIFLDSYKRRLQEPIKNGSVGRVVGLDAQSGQARIEIDKADGSREIRRVDLQADQHRQPVGLAYAVHSNKFQGAEVSIVQVMPGMGQTNANSAYSMVTRSMRATYIYLDKVTHGLNPIKAIGQAWSQREQKQSAHSKMAEVRQRDKDRAERAAEIAGQGVQEPKPGRFGAGSRRTAAPDGTGATKPGPIAAQP
jgi:ATP-dependent exoDNAse (exonuclease V) alpha subunit